jgi:hypothetical protein
VNISGAITVAPVFPSQKASNMNNSQTSLPTHAQLATTGKMLNLNYFCLFFLLFFWFFIWHSNFFFIRFTCFLFFILTWLLNIIIIFYLNFNNFFQLLYI